MKTFTMLMMAALTILSFSAFAQSTSDNKLKDVKQQSEKIKYTCPMHPEVTSDKPGNCPKCGMALKNLSPKEKMKYETMKMYTCPMHPDIKSDKSGKCPKCGMMMKPTETTAGVYSCPMHPDVKSDKPGKCSKCGMALKESKEDSSHHH